MMKHSPFHLCILLALSAASAETLALDVTAAGILGAAALTVIYDPLAPNWRLEERALGGEAYHFSLRAKSFRTGGDGEAMQVFKRRALQLQHEMGFSGYRILDYSEGIESSTPLSSRYAEGTIQLVRAEAGAKPQPDIGIGAIK
jgi:hypothetical protein